jgi:hypothetical protein
MVGRGCIEVKHVELPELNSIRPKASCREIVLRRRDRSDRNVRADDWRLTTRARRNCMLQTSAPRPLRDQGRRMRSLVDLRPEPLVKIPHSFERKSTSRARRTSGGDVCGFDHHRSRSTEGIKERLIWCPTRKS